MEEADAKEDIMDGGAADEGDDKPAPKVDKSWNDSSLYLPVTL